VSPHEFLCEDLAAFESGGRPAWPEDCQSARCKDIREPVYQGLLRSHYGQIDSFALREIGELIHVTLFDIDLAGQSPDAGIG
jgi:hypothetical protein